jgi:hypothetical protein
MKKTKQTPINITEVLAQLSALAPTPTEPEYKQLKKYKPHEWDSRRRTMVAQFIEDWGTEDPKAVESLLQELQARPELYDPEFLLQALTRGPLDDLRISMTSPERFQRQIDYLEGLRAKISTSRTNGILSDAIESSATISLAGWFALGGIGLVLVIDAAHRLVTGSPFLK